MQHEHEQEKPQHKDLDEHKIQHDTTELHSNEIVQYKLRQHKPQQEQREHKPGEAAAAQRTGPAATSQ